MKRSSSWVARKRISTGKVDGHTTVHSYVSTEEKVELMNRARFLIARSGYTTMMEWRSWTKSTDSLHPPPARQSRSTSLAIMPDRAGSYPSQYKLTLAEDVEEAMKYRGFPEMTKTRENVKRLYGDVFKKHLCLDNLLFFFLALRCIEWVAG